MHPVRRAYTVVGLVLELLVPRPAQAQVIDGDALVGIAIVGIVLGVLVTPVGAMVTTLDGEPTKEWGRSSLVFGSISTITGALALTLADDDGGMRVFGGIALGLGVNGLLWGTLSEATLPYEDPGIEGRPRPSDSAAALTIGGSF